MQHGAEHDITTDEVEDVLCSPDELDRSTSTGRPIAFGYTRAGRYIAVVVEEIDDVTVYPITTFEVTQ